MAKFRIEGLRQLYSLIKELSVGLRNLSFEDNFNSFTQDLTINAGEEVRISNQLTNTPKYYIIVSQEGNGLVTKGITSWNQHNLYLINNGSTQVTIKVIFFK